MIRCTVQRLLAGSLIGLAVLSLPVSRLHAQAQATTGIIRGLIVDPNGAPVGGAQVVLRETQTNFQRTVTADAGGNFAASLLPLGIYEVTARGIGFNPVTEKGIVLRVGQSVDLRLSLLAITLEAVNVEAAPAVVDPSKTEASVRLPVQAIAGLPNNGRNYLNLTTLTPNVAIVQGPDGDELSVGGQRGIHNNVSVDGADFNNPFFGEQRGGQRPAFTFNLDAVQDFVVVADGANAEFGRSERRLRQRHHQVRHQRVPRLGPLLRQVRRAVGRLQPHASPAGPRPGSLLISRSTSSAARSAGRWSATRRSSSWRTTSRSTTRPSRPHRPAAPSIRRCVAFTDTAFGGALPGDFGPISRTNDANALLAKLDFRLSPKHNAIAQVQLHQVAAAERHVRRRLLGPERQRASSSDYSHAVNGSLTSLFSSSLSNEFRFQWAREDRPRPYNGPINPGRGRPFPDTDIGFVGPNGFPGYRVGMPFFIPRQGPTTTGSRCWTTSRCSRATTCSSSAASGTAPDVNQTFLGFANGRMAFNSVNGFINYVDQRHRVRRVLGRRPTHHASQARCPAGDHDHRPGRASTSSRPACGRSRWTRRARRRSSRTSSRCSCRTAGSRAPTLTVNYGLRWEAQIEPEPDHADLAAVLRARSSARRSPTRRAPSTFPGDGTIPSD